MCCLNPKCTDQDHLGARIRRHDSHQVSPKPKWQGQLHAALIASWTALHQKYGIFPFGSAIFVMIENIDSGEQPSTGFLEVGRRKTPHPAKIVITPINVNFHAVTIPALPSDPCTLQVDVIVL